MAVSFNATGGAQTGTTSLTVTGCARTNGDMMLLFVHHKGSGTPVGPSAAGWSTLTSIASTSGLLTVFWKWATATGTESNLSVTGLTSSSVGSMASFSGVDPDSPFVRNASMARAKAQANAEGTYGVSGSDGNYFDWAAADMAVAAIGYDNDASSAWSFALLYKSGTSDFTGSMVEIADGLTTGGTDCGGAWAYTAATGTALRGFSPTPTEGSAGTASNANILLCLRGDITPAAVSTLTDDFNDNSFDTAKWYESTLGTNGSGAEVNQRLELTAGSTSSNEEAVLSLDRFSLDAVSVKIPADPTTTSSHQYFGITDSDTFSQPIEGGGAYFDWDVANNLLYARYAQPSSTSSVSVTYDATTRAANPFWRITRSGNTITFQYGNGTSWSTIRTLSHSGYDTATFSLDNARAFMSIDATAAGTLYFDDFDITGPTSQTVSPTGIASAGAFGTATVTLQLQIVSPTGIASAEAFGTPKLNLNVVATGIASGEAFGTARVSLTVVPSGISSAEAFGTATITPGPVTVSPSGIASGEAFGTATVSIAGGPQTVSPSGVASGEAFGTATVSLKVSPTGIASGEALGNPTVINRQIVSPSGIASGGAFGTATVSLAGTVQTISPTGIPSQQVFGTAVVTVVALPQSVTGAGGVAGGEDFGKARVKLMHRRVFRPPTVNERVAYRGDLYFWDAHEGVSLLKIDGQYHQVRWPSDAEIASATAFYRGGFENELTQGEVDDLTAAGYGDGVVLVPVT